MNEMQLFEVGFSMSYGGAYCYKYYVAAIDDLDARSKARRFMLADAKCGEDDGELSEEELEKYMDEVAGLMVTRNQSLGMVIV